MGRITKIGILVLLGIFCGPGVAAEYPIIELTDEQFSVIINEIPIEYVAEKSLFENYSANHTTFSFPYYKNKNDASNTERFPYWLKCGLGPTEPLSVDEYIALKNGYENAKKSGLIEDLSRDIPLNEYYEPGKTGSVGGDAGYRNNTKTIKTPGKTAILSYGIIPHKFGKIKFKSTTISSRRAPNKIKVDPEIEAIIRNKSNNREMVNDLTKVLKQLDGPERILGTYTAYIRDDEIERKEALEVILHENKLASLTPVYDGY